MPDDGALSESARRGELRRWWEEHSQLDELVEALTQALARGSRTAAGVALEAFASAMESHLCTEEDLYFPLVEALSPASTPILQKARGAHHEVRERIEEIRDRLGHADLDEVRDLLAAMLDHFRLHEQLESKLISDLEQSSPG